MLNPVTRRIGLLAPSSSTTQEIEFARVLPQGLSLHVARLGLRRIEAESTVRVVDELEAESRKLGDADVDVIMLAATAPSSRQGAGSDKEIARRITAASGKPATTASTALLEALQMLGIRRLVIGAPWSEAVNRFVAAFLEANGIEVLAQAALGHVDNLDVGRLDESTAYEMGRRVDRPDAEAVMLACGNWRTLGVIDRLERELAKPVLSTNQVTLWAALRLAGGVDRLAGCGSLLSRHLAA